MGLQHQAAPFFSHRMATAAITVLPHTLAGGILGILTASQLDQPTLAAALWTLFYGLSLLAMRGFAPRALVLLGTYLTLLGLIISCYFLIIPVDPTNQIPIANAIMIAGFGLGHLFYGAASKFGAPSQRQ